MFYLKDGKPSFYLVAPVREEAQKKIEFGDKIIIIISFLFNGVRIIYLYKVCGRIAPLPLKGTQWVWIKGISAVHPHNEQADWESTVSVQCVE